MLGRTITTKALILATVGLVLLGLVARWASGGTPERSFGSTTANVRPGGGTHLLGPVVPTDPAKPSVSAQPSSQVTASQPTATGRSVAGVSGDTSGHLIVVPDSDCHQFTESRGRFPTVTISVQNACQK
jgi:hypothetical protein